MRLAMQSSEACRLRSPDVSHRGKDREASGLRHSGLGSLGPQFNTQIPTSLSRNQETPSSHLASALGRVLAEGLPSDISFTAWGAA